MDPVEHLALAKLIPGEDERGGKRYSSGPKLISIIALQIIA